GRRQLACALGRERDPELVVLDLFRDADDHRGLLVWLPGPGAYRAEHSGTRNRAGVGFREEPKPRLAPSKPLVPPPSAGPPQGPAPDDGPVSIWRTRP